MIRIGIVGSDNSHALAYSRLANVDRVLGDRCRVVALWGDDPDRTRAVARDGQIPTVHDDPEGFVDAVDLALVVDRHGDLHAGHALPFLSRGIPVYVDKPLAIRIDDGERILAAARRSGCPVTSFSALRFGPATDALADDLERIGAVRAAHFAGPCDFESQYGGPFFYATHVAEVALRVIGEDVESLIARRHGKTVAVQVDWTGGAIATFSYLGDAAYHFHATLFGTEGMTAREILGGDGAYTEALRKLVDMAETGVPPLTDSQLLRPIRVVHAIQQSLAEGGVTVTL